MKKRLFELPNELVQLVFEYVLPDFSKKHTISKKYIIERNQLQTISKTFYESIIPSWNVIIQRRWNLSWSENHLHPLFVLLFSDCLRFRQESCCQKTIKSCLIPSTSLESLEYKKKRLSQFMSANLYDLDDVVYVIKSLYPDLYSWKNDYFTKQKKKEVRIKNKELRESRQKEIRKLVLFMTRLPFTPTELHDLEHKFIQRGSLKNLQQFKDALTLYVEKRNASNVRRLELINKLTKMSKQSWTEKIKDIDRYPLLQIDFIKEGTISIDHSAVQKACVQWINDEIEKLKRRKLLQTELEKFGLQLRADSFYCKMFIEGNTNNTLEQVVATMRITSFLFKHGHSYWSINRIRFENTMKEYYIQCSNWYEACEKTMLLPLEEPYFDF